LAVVVITASAGELPPADADALVMDDFPFGHAQLLQLETQGQIMVTEPGGQQLQVQLITLHRARFADRYDIQVNGLPGTITRRGSRFFASMPTTQGSLRLENDGTSTRLVNEQWLQVRNHPSLDDFKQPTTDTPHDSE